MDALRACVLALLLVAVGAFPQEDGKRTQGRFYISLSDIPILGSFFAHHTGNETVSNKTTILKHLQLYPILPSLVATSGQLNADADGKANCDQHNNHNHPHYGTHMEGTQKLTTAAPASGIILDSKVQTKPEQVSTHLKPNEGSPVNTLVNPSLTLVKPSDAAVPHLPSHHNTAIPASVDSQKQPALVFQYPFTPNKGSSGPNVSQGQVASSTNAHEVSTAVSTEKPGFFEIFHVTEASQINSATTQHPSGSNWSESFGIPSYPIMPGYTRPPAVPQNPHIPTHQMPVNNPYYPFFPSNQWPGTIQMPGAFGIPEGTVNLPSGIFQYPPAQTQPSATKAQEHSKLFLNIWPTKQPQHSQQSQVNSDKEVQQPTETPQTSQQTGPPQDHQVYHTNQPAYGQHNWHQGFPYMTYHQLMANSQGSMPEILQQNFAGSLQQMTPTQQQDVTSHSNPQLQRFPQNYKSIYAPMPLLLQRL